MRTVYRKISVGATDAQTGDFIRYTESLPTDDLMFKAVAASSAFPGFFQSVNFDNKTLIDGGVLINLDIAGAVERCKEVVSSDSKIIIDIVMTSGDVLDNKDVADFNSIQMLRRYFAIASYQKTMVWITHGKANFPEVQFRYIVAPKAPLNKDFVPIGFRPKAIQDMIEKGIQDAKDTVQEGENNSYARLTADWAKAMMPSPTPYRSPIADSLKE